MIKYNLLWPTVNVNTTYSFYVDCIVYIAIYDAFEIVQPWIQKRHFSKLSICNGIYSTQWHLWKKINNEENSELTDFLLNYKL